MKTLLLLATVLLSVSAFAETSDCSLNTDGYDLSIGARRALGKKFKITKGDARFSLRLQTQCQNNVCSTYASVIENDNTLFAGAEGQSGAYSYFIQSSAEKNAINNLASCL